MSNDDVRNAITFLRGGLLPHRTTASEQQGVILAFLAQREIERMEREAKCICAYVDFSRTTLSICPGCPVHDPRPHI